VDLQAEFFNADFLLPLKWKILTTQKISFVKKKTLHTKTGSKTRLTMMTRRDFLTKSGWAVTGMALTQVAATGLAVSGMTVSGMSATGCSDRKKNASNIPTDVKSKVAIAKADNYDLQILRSRIRNMFDQIGGLSDIIKPGARVAMKVNLTGGLFFSKEYAKTGIDAHWTHPSLVQAVGEAILDAGAKELFIMESLYEDTTYELAGYPEMAKALGARLIDLEKPDPYVDYIRQKTGDDWLVYEEFIFNRLVMEADAFVTIAKLKCHGNCGVTLSMKNHIGLVPVKYYCTENQTNNRSAMHGNRDESATRLPRVIIDMVRSRPIDLAIIDGIHTTEGGEGPWVRNTFGMVQPGVIIAGKNPVATDAVSTAVMGFNPDAPSHEVPFQNSDNHLALAREKGFGTNRLDEIEILGSKLDEVIYPFKPARYS
jgi:uncharacterized protein (DUF362 family)